MSLTPKRKLAVDLLINEYPEIAETKVVTLKQIRTLFDKLKENRKKGGIVIGYPLWLTIKEEYRTDKRGVYKLPEDDSNGGLTDEDKSGNIVVRKYYTPDSFRKEIEEAGIEF